MSDATAHSWTLLLKNAHITVLLFTSSQTTLSVIKSELFKILQDRYPNGLPTSISPSLPGLPQSEMETDVAVLPQAAEEIQFARLVDESDSGKGWFSLEGRGGEEEEEEEGVLQSVQGCGLRDGAVVAFKFGEDEEWNVRFPTYEEGDAES